MAGAGNGYGAIPGEEVAVAQDGGQVRGGRSVGGRVLLCVGCGGWVDPAVWGWCPDCGAVLHAEATGTTLGPDLGEVVVDLRGPSDDGAFAVDWAQPA